MNSQCSRDCTILQSRREGHPISQRSQFSRQSSKQVLRCSEHPEARHDTDHSSDALADTCQQFSSMQQLSHNSQFSRGCTTLQRKREGHPISHRSQFSSSQGRHVFRCSEHPEMSHDTDHDADAVADTSQQFSITQVAPSLRSRPSTSRRAHSEDVGETTYVPRRTHPRRLSRHFRLGLSLIQRLVIMVGVQWWVGCAGQGGTPRTSTVEPRSTPSLVVVSVREGEGARAWQTLVGVASQVYDV